MTKFYIHPSKDAIMKEIIAWFGHFPEGQMAFDKSDYKTLLHDACNAIFTKSIAEGEQRMREALDGAVCEAEILANHFNFLGGTTYLIQIIVDKIFPLSMKEYEVIRNFSDKMNNDVAIKYVLNQKNIHGKVIVKIAATNLSEKRGKVPFNIPSKTSNKNRI